MSDLLVCTEPHGGLYAECEALEQNGREEGEPDELGDNWDLKSEVLRQVEKFPRLMYGQGRESSVDIFRVKMLRKMVGEDKTLTSRSKVDLARLPYCHSALNPHIQRTNHRVALYKRAY